MPGRARTRGWLRHRRTTSGAADPRTVDGSDPTPTEGRRPRPGRCPSWTTARCHPRAHRSSIGRPQAGTSCLKKWPLDLRPGQPSTRWRVLISSNLPRRGDDSLSEVRHRARTTRKPRKPDLCGERRSILFAATRHRRGSAVRSSIHWCGRLELTIHRAGVQSWLARLRRAGAPMLGMLCNPFDRRRQPGVPWPQQRRCWRRGLRRGWLRVDASRAVDEVRLLQPAVVLLDVQLPRLNGFELARTARRARPATDRDPHLESRPGGLWF